MNAQQIVKEWIREVHKHYCGASLSCGNARNCGGRPGAIEIAALRRVLRGAK